MLIWVAGDASGVLGCGEMVSLVPPWDAAREPGGPNSPAATAVAAVTQSRASRLDAIGIPYSIWLRKQRPRVVPRDSSDTAVAKESQVGSPLPRPRLAASRSATGSTSRRSLATR